MLIIDNSQLNRNQIDAITDDNNILLIACPGSGKTRTLTYKIAYELSRLSDPKKYIIALTYTNIAADEIKDRIELLGVDTKQLWIGTIHSFCLEWILRPYSLYLPDLKMGFRVINSHESERILTDLCNSYNEHYQLKGKNKITYYDCSFMATPKPEFKITTLNANKTESVKKIISVYLKKLRDNNQVDFEQILFYSYKILLEKPIINSVLSNIFPYILIDEYQDTKEIQYHIICSILKHSDFNTKLFTVGDPNQSIYQTLGGYPINKAEFENLSGLQIKQLELTDNYRSSKKIIDYFDYYKTFDNQINASGIHSGYDSSISLNNSVIKDNLIDEIAKLIEFNINEKGISQNEICVVAPQWVHIAAVARKLMIKLPNYSFDGPGMAPFSRDIENIWFKVSRLLLTEPSPNMYIRRLRWSDELIHELKNAGVQVNLDKKGLLKLCNSIQLKETNGINYLKLSFDIILSKLSISIDDFPFLKEHHVSFFSSCNDRINKLLKEGFDAINSIETFKNVFKQNKGINICTCHGVKGAEYDTVIAFALLKDYIPHFSDQNGHVNAKKLLYVIASRARKNLHLIAERQRLKPFGTPRVEYTMTPHLLGYLYEYCNL